MKDEHLHAEHWSLGDLFYPCYCVVPAFKITSTQPCTKTNILSVVQATTAIHTHSYTPTLENTNIYTYKCTHIQTYKTYILLSKHIFFRALINNNFSITIKHSSIRCCTQEVKQAFCYIVYAIHQVFLDNHSCQICVSV